MATHLIDSGIGLHCFMVHNPEDTIRRVFEMGPRKDGKPRTHKIVYHSAPDGSQKCDWLYRMPPWTQWTIRNLDTSVQYIHSSAEARAYGREQAEHHARYFEDGIRKGVQPNQMIFEGHNEPQPGEWPYVVEYELERLYNAKRLGVPRLSLMNFPVGNPGTHFGIPEAGLDYHRWDPIRQETRHPQDIWEGDVWSYHGYCGWDGPWASWSDKTQDYKFPNEGNRILMWEWPEENWAFTEGGMDNGVNQRDKSSWRDVPDEILAKWGFPLNEEGRAMYYMICLNWMDIQFALGRKVKAWVLFTDDYENNEWEKFNTAIAALANRLIEHTRRGIQVPIWGSGDNRVAKWQFLIEQWSTRLGVNPQVVATVVAAGSGGVSDFINTKNAAGLIPLVPATGRPQKEVLWNPNQNLRIGCAQISANIRQAGGDLATALAWYAGAASPTSPGGQQYLSTFKGTWEQLFPGEPCPITATVPPPVPNTLREELISRGDYFQVIRFNPTAALQKKIREDGMFPNSPEFEFSFEGKTYIAQRSESLATQKVRVYYCLKGQWDKVMFVDK